MQTQISADRGRAWSRLRGPAEAGLRAFGAATAHWRPGPDFLVIGGKRCGSTTLFYGLLQHPAVVPQVLSAGWLPLREHRKGTRWLDADRPGGAWYRAHFATTFTRSRYARHQGVAITGEATPWYLFAPGAAARAAREAPEARLIAVLREPARRAFSQFQEQRKRGHERLGDFAAALEAEPERARNGVVDASGVRRSAGFAIEHLTYRRQSEYVDGLAEWLAHYPREQLFVVSAEELYADVAATLARAADFLGLPEFAFEPAHRNRTAPAEPDPAVMAELAAHFAPLNTRLEHLLGQRFPW
ncbi:MAG: sulfotransferase domain-containing protein [Acidimicrobiia bacterium]|nr:sulfotransferase domain-containing protein [Acidimicrobiia bacterium]